MSVSYVPKAQHTPEQWDYYLAAARERNRRAYHRKKHEKRQLEPLRILGSEVTTVLCQSPGCDSEVVPICNFCKEERYNGEAAQYWP